MQCVPNDLVVGNQEDVEEERIAAGFSIRFLYSKQELCLETSLLLIEKSILSEQSATKGNEA
jgi:hypothetical protein